MTKTKVAEQPELVEQVVETTNDVEETENFVETQYLELLKNLTNTQENLTLLKNNLKRFYKVTEKQLTKLNKSKRYNNKNRSPTGFGKVKPVPLSLKTLLNLDDNIEMTRPAVTKKLYEYIDSHNLRSEEDKRIIKVNDNLSKAFKLTKDQVKSINSSKSVKDDSGLNFYNIQKYVATLYQEVDTSSTTTTSATTVVVTTPASTTKSKTVVENESVKASDKKSKVAK
jgi:hypothetical protein